MKTAINLLPTAYRRQRMLRRRTFQWSTAVCAVLVAMGVVRWYELREHRALDQQLAALARDTRPAQRMLREITQMRKQLRSLHQQEAVARQLEARRQVLTVLGLVSQAARRTDGQLRVTKLDVADLQATGAEESPERHRDESGAVTLIGLSLDSPTVATLHDMLLESGLFAEVRLIRSNERDQAGLAMYDYEVRCEL